MLHILIFQVDPQKLNETDTDPDFDFFQSLDYNEAPSPERDEEAIQAIHGWV